MSGNPALAPWIHAQAGGLLLGAAFALDGLGLLAWPALWLIVRCLDRRSGWERLGDGSLAGVWWAGMSLGPWLYDATRAHLDCGSILAAGLTAAAICYGAAWVGLFAVVWVWLPRPRWLTGPAAWVLLEAMRTDVLGGVPWALLGHSQHALLALVQIAELGGVPLVSFLVAMGGTAAAGRGRERVVGLGVSGVVIGLSVGFGLARMETFADPATSGVTVRGVSGGHLSADRLTSYVAATRDGPRADVVVWPEKAVPGYLQADVGAIGAVTAVARRHEGLIVGGLRHEPTVAGRRHFNSVALFGPGGSMRGLYDKRILVPFAERAPAAALEMIDDPLSPGPPSSPSFVAAGLRLAPLLSWEAVSPDLVRDWVRARADVLVSLSSDVTLGDGVRQMVDFSRFRAIETRRWLLRVSGTDRTIAIDPAGRLWAREVIAIEPGVDRPMTLYVRRPGLVPGAAALILAVLVPWSRVRRRRER